MPIKKWIFPQEKDEISQAVKRLAKECKIGSLAASVLASRGYMTEQEANLLINPGRSLSSPFLLTDMEKAADRIMAGIASGERMTVYGDYDCDGITATAILFTYLTSLGGKVEYYIPEREGDGYGINKSALRRLHEKGVSLIITVDNGISALEEADLAAELGLTLVITDHHQPGETLPVAHAVVNPHRKDDTSGLVYLSGAGVAFKLVTAIEEKNGRTVNLSDDASCELSPVLRSALELAAVGTVGDIVPLLGENRILVQAGLSSLALDTNGNIGNTGLRELARVAGAALSELTAQTIAFLLVPRINAAGRMGDAAFAMSLLLCEDAKAKEAVALSRQLDEMNRQRQATEVEITQQIEALLMEDTSILESRVLILAGDNWNHGVLGIVAARMVERYGKPTLIMTRDSDCSDEADKAVYKGSARSLGEFHLYEALSYCKAALDRFGGHKLAAGFSIIPDKLSDLRSLMEEYAKTSANEMPIQSVNIDKRLSIAELTVAQVDGLSCLEPYGDSHPSPLFLLENVEVAEVVKLSGGRHVKLILKSAGMNVTTLWFGMTEERLCCRKGDRVSVVGSLMINEYQSKRSVSFKIDDLRLSCFDQEGFFAESGWFDELCRNGKTVHDVFPTRDELAAVYRVLKANNGFYGDSSALYMKLLPHKMGYCKLKIALTALREVGLTAPDVGGGIALKSLPVGEKVDIFSAPILQSNNQ